MKKKRFIFTVTESVINEFQAYAESIGTSAARELERLIRAELKKIKQENEKA